MKNYILLFTLITTCTIAAMDDTQHEFLVHQSLHAYLDCQLRNWLLCKMAHACTLDCDESPVSCIKLTSDGRVTITASADYKIRVWDIASGLCRYTLVGHSGCITL